ncbi:MAG: hypothetical protein KAU14_08835, partial [Thermoplasmata archaeon]|nr:hypothetical protein [Thermoplasmata archaeon]
IAGTYTSQPYAAHADRGVKWGTIHWNADVPNGADVEFQVAVSNDGKSWDFVGPDDTSATFYNDVTGNVLYWGHYGKIVRYKAFLRAAPSGDTPKLHDVTLTWREMAFPTVELTWPNGGENLMHEQSYAITWTATGDLQSGSPVALFYSLDSGSTWTDITTGTENDGTYLWTLPSNEDVERALVKVVVTSLDGTTVVDTSDATFSIDPPPENPETMDRVISPNSGDQLISGKQTRVEWLLKNEDTVSLHYSTDFGQSWNPIVENIPNLELYNWEIPEDLESDNIILKVQGEDSEVTSGVFMIGPEDTSGAQTGGGEPGSSNEASADLVLSGLVAALIGLFAVLVAVVIYGGNMKR